MIITFIAATDRKGVIGHKGGLPWKIPSDLDNFKNYTSEKTIVMGRNTFESLPFLLPNRTSIVLTSNHDVVQKKVDAFKNTNPGKEVPPVMQIDSLKNLFNCDLDHIEELVIIGGNSLYSALYKHADKLVMSLVDANVTGDTFFGPRINWSEWDKEEAESIPPYKGPKDEFSYSVNTFYRKNRDNVYDFMKKGKMSKLDSVRLAFNMS